MCTPGSSSIRTKGYDGCSGLGSSKKKIRKSITTKGENPSLGLEFKPMQMGSPNTKLSLCEILNTSNNEKAYENTHPKPKEIKPNTNDHASPYELDHIFVPNILPLVDNHVTTTAPITQTLSAPWIDIFWDRSQPASEHGVHEPYDSDSHIFTFD